MVQADEQLTAVDYYIGANVEVASDVAIAAGVVLEAAPGARLVVAAGVCIGTGVIVQAVGGKLTLGIGVNLGTGVLIVGQGLVGPHACIGAESSLLNPEVTAGAVVPARSLLGIDEQHTGDRSSQHETNGQSTSDVNPPNNDAAPAASEPESNLAPANIVYGREQVTQLMKTLFPHRDALNGNGQSPP